MNGRAIVVEGVWKKFHRGELHDSLRDLVPALTKRLLGRGPSRAQLGQGDFWALRDVSFEVRSGEALGVIGPNGAGKSTLLRILSRILRPNRGRVVVPGRVGALIEIAAGFHPDLTGRENIYLQGAIMGMKSAETRRKFDEIVEFSEIEEFIDTPVKRYSSGMSARLGFSIAAHLDPDILLIDEVLAVGDFAFQRKAFLRIADMLNREIPVVLVSHQLEKVASVCSKAIVLCYGQVMYAGDPSAAVASYVGGELGREAAVTKDVPIRIDSLELKSADCVRSGGWIEVAVRGEVLDGRRLDSLNGVSIKVRSVRDGAMCFATSSRHCGVELPPDGPFELLISLQFNVLPGVYVLQPHVYDRHVGKEILDGPARRVVVAEGIDFVGRAQMNPRMQLRTTEKLDEVAKAARRRCTDQRDQQREN